MEPPRSPRPATLDAAVHELRQGNAAFGARQLRVLGTAEASDALRAALSDPNAEVRGVAAMQLSLIRRPGNAETLGKQLDCESDPGVRYLLIHALGTSREAEAGGWLLPLLASEHVADVKSACEGLASLDAHQAVGPVQSVLRTGTPETRVAAFRALVSLDCRDPWMLEELE